MTQALTYVEIDVPVCALTYGTAPCMAATGVTGAIKCFNSIATCQDRVNFDEDEITLRFAKPTEYLPRAIDCIPSIRSVEFSPAIVSLGQNLGQRATLTVTFRDHPHADTGQGYDKYRTERAYDPYRQGTYWGKFRARQKFLQGRSLRWIQGVVGDELPDMESRRFVIESFSGPTRDGTFTIVAKDMLKLGDGDRAQAPRPSNGFLSADITAVATSAVLLPSGIGNAEYAASGHLCIGGNEVVSFTRSGDNLTIVRGQLGTTATTHKAQDRVQTVLRYAGVDAALILQDLFVNYAGMSSANINVADWTAETAAFLGTVYTANICEPTPVSQLSSELIEQAALSIWDDNLASQLRLRVLRAVTTDADTFTPDNTLGEKLQTREQPEKRVSRVLVYFGQKDPTKPLSNLDNYRSTSLTVDDDAEADYGAIALKTIYSRWIPDGGRSVADRLGAIVLGRFRDPPRRVDLQLMRYAGTDPELGIGYRVEGASIQDATGAAVDLPIQCTRLNPGPDKYVVEAEEMLWTAPAADTGSRYVIFDANTFNINLRTSHDSIYSTPQSGDVVNCIINAGVVIGSNSVSQYAFDVGLFPAGVTVNIKLNGRIQGRGGLGGGGGSSIVGAPGGPGGPAFYTRQSCALDVSSGGEIWGGGGGGGGGGASNAGGSGGSGAYGGGGGGGGAGTLAGQSQAGGAGAGGTGAAGTAGTATAGGVGGGGSLSFGGNGGAGGGPALAGAGGGVGSPPGFPGGAGGSPGSAIDGISYVTLTLGAGDIRGSQIN